MSKSTDEDISLEDMANLMKPGLRVVRGKDWNGGFQDGNGPGTVISEHASVKGSWRVKWDMTGSMIYYDFEHKHNLKIIDFRSSLGKKLFVAKSTFDLKIICEGKTIECHKSVLCCHSDVFETMFLNMSMAEAKSGVVKIDDFKANTMETLLYFLYSEVVKDTEMINTELLHAAEKYNIPELLEICSDYLKQNLSLTNVLDVLVSAHLTNQKTLFDAASDFTYRNRDNLAKTTAWEDFKKTNPTLVANILCLVLEL